MSVMNMGLFFQYCQKLVVLSSDKESVLLAKRRGEADYDGLFSFIGGKMETSDASLLDDLEAFQPKIDGIDDMAQWAIRLIDSGLSSSEEI